MRAQVARRVHRVCVAWRAVSPRRPHTSASADKISPRAMENAGARVAGCVARALHSTGNSVAACAQLDELLAFNTVFEPVRVPEAQRRFRALEGRQVAALFVRSPAAQLADVGSDERDYLLIEEAGDEHFDAQYRFGHVDESNPVGVLCAEAQDSADGFQRHPLVQRLTAWSADNHRAVHAYRTTAQERDGLNAVVERLTLSIQRNVVVRDVSFVAAAGTVTAIVGPAGCGKSTLLDCLAGRRGLGDCFEPAVHVACHTGATVPFARAMKWYTSQGGRVAPSLAADHTAYAARHTPSSFDEGLTVVSVPRCRASAVLASQRWAAVLAAILSWTNHLAVACPVVID